MGESLPALIALRIIRIEIQHPFFHLTIFNPVVFHWRTVTGVDTQWQHKTSTRISLYSVRC
jgi:hypothetical protein